jgi:hypothetical protein
MLINTPGSGKTRLILEGLCRHWGFYFVARRDEEGIGSSDFSEAMSMDDSADYRSAQSQKMKNPDAMQHMKEKANHRLLQLLLARFYLLRLFVEEARKLRDGLDMKNHRRAWVLSQVQPFNIFQEDIFRTLYRALRTANTTDLREEIQALYLDVADILGDVTNPVTGMPQISPLYCVVDESQLLTTARMGEFCSDDGLSERSLMREVYTSLSEALLVEQMLLIFSGTGIDLQALMASVATSALKSYKYVIKQEIGAFDNRAQQAEYIKRYIGVDWKEPSWKAFLDRAWNWCCGRYLLASFHKTRSHHFVTRYRNTAALVRLVIEGGYQSPHTILNQYVAAATKFVPTDGEDWLALEPGLPPGFNVEAKVIPLVLNKMST